MCQSVYCPGWCDHIDERSSKRKESTLPRDQAEQKANQRKELDEAIAKANLDPAAQVESKIAYGHPAQVLIDESKNASLLVLGYKGHGGFTGMLTGSVSLQVVHHAECPVVVVRGG